MSGDVQPRKRKDKKRKKDDLGLEEPRGTSATLGEGDVFMHSHHEQGTGGHWCAKIIFFSLLAVLITLIGLIILENRGLSELEANAVESRYSGVLEGWLEDAPDDDHHDEHTLELSHHDNDDDDEEHLSDDDHLEDDAEDDYDEDDDEETEHSDEAGDNDNQEDQDADNEDEADDIEDELDKNDENELDDDDEPDFYNKVNINDDDDDDDDRHSLNDENDTNQDQIEQDDEDDEYRDEDGYYEEDNENEEENIKSDEESNEIDNANDDDSIVNNEFDKGNNESQEDTNENDDDDNEDDEHDDEDEDVEVEKLEKAEPDEDPISTELPALPEDEDNNDDIDDDRSAGDLTDEEPDQDEYDKADEKDEYLEIDDNDEPMVEHITAPPGKPLPEVEEETSSEKPPNTLAEEEEYEKRQEELRREEEQSSHKDGGNSLVDDDWPGEPSDAYWRDQLDSAEREMLQGDSSAAVERTSADPLRDSARARWIRASALDRAAEEKRDNTLLSRAITAYLHLLKMNERLSDKKLLQVTGRTLDRIQFRGNYLNAEPVYKLLIRRFPNDPAYRNNLTISFLMANRADLAEESIKETLERWPDDRLALAHYGFVLKTRHNRYEEAAEAFRKALEGDTGPANEARFYYHYGDSLLLLGRREEAHVVHKRGAALGHFLSPAQRSLYNVPRLKSSPWWRIEDTPYSNLAKSLEKSWKDILKEAQAAEASYEKEKEGLKEHGEWSQLDLFVRGREVPDRCKRAPVTCSIVKGENAAAGCRRGQIKFSSMAAGTHVRPHVGPTNCRLRMHLGLSNTKDTYIRVDQEIRQWREGRVLLFDDSFEHEVWHNGTGTRLVLIVDVWHPYLTAAERRQLPAI
ncbi:unnamed protein product [Chilo suppressalis]|uniref:Aspartyl/asparaginy/proline hydroxylase domain-containing protein n=1 Tax=Chilo suppressalis TaxID=168631 RepID=A0ABN8BBC2_CHISP|nr:unnamed protein product [Chilo suppressalis]